MTGADAVETVHAPAVVDSVIVQVNAGCLAVLLAEVTIPAFAGIDHRAENREPGEKTQNRTDRADGIAVCPAVPCGKNEYDHERHGCYHESRQTLEPHVLMLERVPTCLLGNPCAEIVAPQPDRRKKILHDAAERTIWRNQHGNRSEPGHEKDNENCQHAVPEPLLLGRPAVELLVAFTPDTERPCYDILKNPQRAYDRAVEPSEDQCQ